MQKKTRICEDAKRNEEGFQYVIIQNPCNVWQMDAIYKSIINCVIMHNIIIEDERDNNLEPFYKCWSIEAWN
jgi:hypothetical protein